MQCCRLLCGTQDISIPIIVNCFCYVWLLIAFLHCRLDEIIVFRQLTKGEVKQIADIMLGEVFKRAEEKEIKIDVTERFKVCAAGLNDTICCHGAVQHAATLWCI